MVSTALSAPEDLVSFPNLYLETGVEVFKQHALS